MAGGNNAAYEQRQQDYVTQGIANFDPDAITLQAYQKLPVDQAALDTMLSHVNAHEVVDFDLVAGAHYVPGQRQIRINNSTGCLYHTFLAALRRVV